MLGSSSTAPASATKKTKTTTTTSDHAKKNTTSGGEMKRADRRSTITILVLGDGTWKDTWKQEWSNPHSIVVHFIPITLCSPILPCFSRLFFFLFPISCDAFFLKHKINKRNRGRGKVFFDFDVCFSVLFRSRTGNHDPGPVASGSAFIILYNHHCRFSRWRCRPLTSGSQ